ncbi:hypothetical protein ACXR0O_03070 [Verrucomicrobiota bacterium sgz303538]
MTVAENITAYRLGADIDVSAVVSDAAGSIEYTGEPRTDARAVTADTETVMNHGRSTAEGLRSVRRLKLRAQDQRFASSDR